MSKKSVVFLTALGVAAAAAGAYVVRRQVAADMADAIGGPTAPVNQWTTDDADALDERLAEASNEELSDAADDQPAAAR